MRVLILSINYAPEPTGFSQHVARLSEYLVRSGVDVTVITGFPFAPAWRRWKEYRGRLFMRREVGGVDVIRVTHFIPRRPRSVWQRLLMEGTFCLAAAAQLPRCPPADVVLYVGAQPSLAFLARIVSRLKRRPYVVWINDLAAEAARDARMVRGRLLQRILSRFEYAAYRGAAGAIVLCDSFQRALIDHGFPGDRIRVIGSPIDVGRIRPVATGPVREILGIPPDALVILYSGSMGVKQGLLNVTSAAGLTQEADVKVVWVLVGEGEMRSTLESTIERDGLQPSVKLLPLQPESKVAETLSAADVLLLNQMADMKDTVIPSKLLTYMAAGKPVLAAVNVESQAALLLNRAKGGILVRPDDPRALATAAMMLSARRGELAGMGARNRAYAEVHFDENKVFDAHVKFLRDVALSADTRNNILRAI